MWSSAWQCNLHGQVQPLQPAFSPSRAGLDGVLRSATVPVWLPWPCCASANTRVASGRQPGGPVINAAHEQPGVGLGARFAGLNGPDPGRDFTAGPPDASVQFGNHEFPLWHVEAPERAVFAGEVMASWLWLVLWPDTAGTLLMESLTLRDLRDPGQDLDLPYGAMSPHLPG